MFERQLINIIEKRLLETRRFIQILQGPRQVGKTALVGQLLAKLPQKSVYASADDAVTRDKSWLLTQWQRARIAASNPAGAVLVIDEVQKVEDWSSAVKSAWDEDTRGGVSLKVLLLGSTPLFAGRGIKESLAGRFETIYAPHWSHLEMAEAFDYTWDDYLTFGGYPGAASLRFEPERWRHYMREAIVEATVARDLLGLVRIEKPALLRSLFFLCCEYSGRILSYTKMLGQLNDAGNTTTLAHYLELLSQCGLVTGVQKFSLEGVRTRASSPKLVALDPALITSSQTMPLTHWRSDPEALGHLIEAVVGAHLWRAVKTSGHLYYWSEGNLELDYVCVLETGMLAIEVKSGRRRRTLPGLAAFLKRNPQAVPLVVGTGGIPIREFLDTPLASWT